MPSKLSLSPMQQEYMMNATHRWNFKTGATRSGKTFIDILAVIPKRIMATHGSGLITIMGNTNLTVHRNVIDPMREIWGKRLVGTPSSRNTVELFGHTCHILGADTISAVKRLQGAGIEYAYGDEVATWNEEVFNMLKSRLDKPNSCFDGTCNPDQPKHFVKKFLDSDADIYQQAYTIDDNPFNDPTFVANLKKEYAGTVYYDRFILGRWVAAEGIIYRLIADNPNRFIIGRKECVLKILPTNFIKILIGVDFGGTGSGTTFVATGFTEGFQNVVGLASEKHMGNIDPEKLNELFEAFVRKILTKYGVANYAYCDSAESILIRGLKATAARKELPISVRNASKTPINDRIRLTAALASQGRFFLTEDCETLKDALSQAMWNSKKLTSDERLDDGTTDIDTLDAFEYTIENDARTLLAVNLVKRG